jgi:hypothetical protein
MTTTTHENIHIYTVANDTNKLTYLCQSSQFANVDVNVFMLKQWTGFVDKITTMTEIMTTHAETDIICFIDAYDVFCFAGVEEIYGKFKEYDCRILLSGELNCFPPDNIQQYGQLEERMKHTGMPPITTNFKYVNSGGYIGYCGDLLRLMNWKTPHEIAEICENGGDQTYFTKYYLEHATTIPEHIKLDYKQTIFQSMYRIEFTDFFFENGRIYNRVLGTMPCFVHFNGFKTYDNLFISLKTGKEENVFDVCLSKIKESILFPKLRMPLDYRVRFFLVFGNEHHHNIPQI